MTRDSYTSPAAAVKGFTLLELIIVISIVGVLISIAAPGFRTLIVQRQVESATQRLADLVVRTRQEALSRHGVVTMRRGGDGWAGAISVYSAADGVANRDAVAADREIFNDDLSAYSVAISDPGDGRWLSFGSRGSVVGRSRPTNFRVCASIDTEVFARTVGVNRSGVVRVSDTSGEGSC